MIEEQKLKELQAEAKTRPIVHGTYNPSEFGPLEQRFANHILALIKAYRESQARVHEFEMWFASHEASDCAFEKMNLKAQLKSAKKLIEKKQEALDRVISNENLVAGFVVDAAALKLEDGK